MTNTQSAVTIRRAYGGNLEPVGWDVFVGDEWANRYRTRREATAAKCEIAAGPVADAGPQTFMGQTFKVGDRVKMKERVPGKGLRVQRGTIVASHGHGSFTIARDAGGESRRVIDDLAHVR